MTPLSQRQRRVLQALLYEAIAVAVVAPVLTLVFDEPPLSSMLLTLAMSAIATAWNVGFNSVFEWWEAHQAFKGRSWRRRVAHGVGFEVGLSLLLIPLMSVWMGIGLWEALLADAGMLLFFLCYTVVFTWVFDRVFGLPQSAQASTVPPAQG